MLVRRPIVVSISLAAWLRRCSSRWQHILVLMMLSSLPIAYGSVECLVVPKLTWTIPRCAESEAGVVTVRLGTGKMYQTVGSYLCLMRIKWIRQFLSSPLRMCVECFLHPYSSVFSCPLLARFGGGSSLSSTRYSHREEYVSSIIYSRLAYLGASAYDLSSHVS